MSLRRIVARPLVAKEFAPFGDVIEAGGEADKIINQGMCDRLNDRARLDFSDGRAGISLFDARARHLPLKVDMLERHPAGSQAFIPVSGTPFLVVVAPDEGGRPGEALAFMTRVGQSVNLLRNTWHGVLTPIGADAQYVVVDRIGEGDNLEEHWLDDPWIVEASE